ncbi:MAG: hypothetical protein K9L60_08780 [Methylovulum sp.]|jgi:hypothetical protein|nr:hypothetical protein [Methylovulum sp.]
MTEDIQYLEKEVKRLKRLANEHAMALHDLIEDNLPAGYHELLGIAQATYVACKNWDDAHQKLLAAQAQLA